MHEISENILKDIRNCATVESLENYRSLINIIIADSDIRLSYIAALGARYFDILSFDRITEIYYPAFKLN